MNSAELETVTTSRSPSSVITANGEVQTNEEATCYVPQPFWLKLRIRHVSGFALSRPMDLDAAGLLARTHATLLRRLSWHADHHFEGLCAASRHKSFALSNKQRRQLTHLDIAFNWSRHVTATKCEQLITEILGCLVPPPAATHAATATLTAFDAPVTTAYSVPILQFSGDSVGIQSCVPLNDVLSCLVRNPAVVPQTPEQIVETVNAIPQEWISEGIVDISVAPTEYVTPLCG